MTLGMDIASALTEIRAAAESIMTSTCVVTRTEPPTAENLNPETLQNDLAIATIYTGKCRVRPFGHRDHTETAGDQVFVTAPHILSLPLNGSEDVSKDDVVTIDSSEDPGLVGAVYVVIDAAGYSNGSARRMLVRSVE